MSKEYEDFIKGLERHMDGDIYFMVNNDNEIDHEEFHARFYDQLNDINNGEDYE